MRHRMSLAGLACLPLLAAPLGAQAVITGVVKEVSSGRAILKVEVVIEKSSRQARTDSAGRYVIESPTGTQIVLFRLLGFRAVRIRTAVKKDDTLHVDATMLRESGAQPLDPVSVSGCMPARGMGRTGVRMVEFRNSAFVQVRAASPIQLGMDGSPSCWVSVVYDNVTIYKSGGRAPPPDFSKDFSVAGLDAIEYYRNRAETPLEFSALGGECGVLVLWSRRGR